MLAAVLLSSVCVSSGRRVRPGPARSGVHTLDPARSNKKPYIACAVVSTPHANFFGPFSASGVSRAPAPPAFDRSAYLPARAQQAYERTVGSTLADAQTT